MISSQLFQLLPLFNYTLSLMIYLDSALISDAQHIASLGWVKGITTNPTLLSKSDLSPAQTLEKLAQLSPGDVYYQVTATEVELMLKEAEHAREILGHKTVIKVPATPAGFQVCAHLVGDMPCTVTAVYNATQAIIAREAQAHSVAVYVNRATRLLGDGLSLVREIKNVLEGYSTQILAASLKSPQEVIDVVKAGADDLTLPLPLLLQLPCHSLSEATVTEFQQKGVGLC